MNWLLIAVLVLLALFTFAGYQRGMLRILFSFGSLLIALLVSYMVTPYVTSYIKEHTGIYAAVQQKTLEYLREKSEDAVQSDPSGGTDAAALTALWEEIAGSAQTGEDTSEKLTDAVTVMQEQLQIPEALCEQIGKVLTQVENGEAIAAAQVQEVIGSKVADLIVSALAFVITLLLVRFILWIVYQVLDIVSHLPVIHGINQTLGMVLGLAEGLLVVWIFFVFLTCIMQTAFGKECLRLIADSKILSVFYNWNALRFLF